MASGRKKRRARDRTELRDCLLALLEREFPAEDGISEGDGITADGETAKRTGAQLQSEALFRRALKDTRSFEVLRSTVLRGEKDEREEKAGKAENGKNGKGEGETAFREIEEAVVRAVREAEKEGAALEEADGNTAPGDP